MTVSHKAVEETTHASALERSPAYVEARRSATDLIEGWEAYEEGLHRLFKAAECGTMPGEFTSLDVDSPFWSSMARYITGCCAALAPG